MLGSKIAGGSARRDWLKFYEIGGRNHMNIFYIIGVIVVVLFILGYFGLR